MICDRCGHHNSGGANFCSSCGEPLTGAEHRTLSLPRVESEPATSDLPDGPDHDRVHFDRTTLGDAVGLLVIRSGPGEGSTFLLEEQRTTIGRHPDSGVFLDDITVSRRHAEVIRADHGFTVRDAGSLNGTYVNRERVEESRLDDGDELQIGRFKLVLVCRVDSDGS